MNYAEFSAAKEILAKRYPQDMLMMAGDAPGDNATKYVLESMKGTPKRNCEADLLNDTSIEGDFVWRGAGTNSVTVAGGEGGGHPALTHGATIYCAGRIERYGFFFHSGHYHPTVENAIPFMYDFIENSCAGQMGGTRDATAERLTKLTLRFYVKGSTGAKYYTTFTELATKAGAYKPAEETPAVATSHSMLSLHSSAMAIPMSASKPMAIGKSTPMSMAGPINHVTSTASLSHAQPVVHKSSDLGITVTGKYISELRLARKRWLPDSEVKRCMLCDKEFGKFTWRHHCRKCGGIFCSTCSDKSAIVNMPATKDGDTEVDVTASAVRVCRKCIQRKDL